MRPLWRSRGHQHRCHRWTCGDSQSGHTSPEWAGCRDPERTGWTLLLLDSARVSQLLVFNAQQTGVVISRRYTDIKVDSPYGMFVGCLTSQQHASVSQGQICSDNFTCCHTQIEVSDQTFYLTQSQYTDTGPTSPSADPITPGAWQGSHWSANF